MKIIFTVLLFLFFVLVQAQSPFDNIIKTPTPGSLGNYGQINNFSSNGKRPSQDPFGGLNERERQIRRRNEQMIADDMKAHEEHKKMIEKIISEALNNINEMQLNEIGYQFPSYKDQPGAGLYYKALEQYKEMLQGRKPLNIKKAVFISENTYLDNKLSFERFDNEIKKMAGLCFLKLKEDKIPLTDDFNKKMVIFHYMSDTFNVKIPGLEKTYVHYPMTYDFEDYAGEKDWTKLFVTKLLNENTGQCHSLPLLYLLIANELKTKAYLAYAPNHSYIKIQHPSGNWVNLELTSGITPTDAFVAQKAYVKAEAIMSGLYMDTLGMRKTVVHCLMDLALGYLKKYGYDDFIKECVDLALEHHSNNQVALSVKSNYTTELVKYVREQYIKRGRPLGSDSLKFKQLAMAQKQIYENIDRLGYAEMPKEMYEAWLKQLEEEKRRRQLARRQVRIKEALR